MGSYNLNKDWFYTYGLSDSMSDHAASLSIGYRF